MEMKKQARVPGCAKVSRDAACLASMQMLVGKLSSKVGWALDAFGCFWRVTTLRIRAASLQLTLGR